MDVATCMWGKFYTVFIFLHVLEEILLSWLTLYEADLCCLRRGASFSGTAVIRVINLSACLEVWLWWAGRTYTLGTPS